MTEKLNTFQMSRLPATVKKALGVEIKPITEDTNIYWEDLSDTFASAKLGLRELAAEVRNLVAHKEVQEKINESPALFNAIMGFTKDAESLSAKFDAVYQRHERMKGLVSDEDFVHYTTLFTDYQALSLTLMNTMLPTMETITMLTEQGEPSND